MNHEPAFRCSSMPREDAERHVDSVAHPNLFGRHREIAFVRDWCAASHHSVLLVGGARGVGKRALVRSIRSHVEANNGMLLSGRFYPRRSVNEGMNPPPDRPLRAFWDALNGVFDKVTELTEAKALIAAIVHEFEDSDDIEALMESMTGFRRLFDERRAGASVPTALAMADSIVAPMYVRSKRFLNTGSVALAVRFLRAISTRIPKLVIGIEHLECADCATFDLIDDLLHDANTRKLFQLIATYREDSKLSQPMERLLLQTALVSLDQPLTPERAASVEPIVRIQLADLSWDEMYQWTMDRFGRDAITDDVMRSLADLVFERSSGNPQFASYMYEYVARNTNAQTLYSQYLATSQSTLPTSLDDLLVQIMRLQTREIQAVVEVVAALGECSGDKAIDATAVELILRRPCHHDVAVAQELGIFNVSEYDQICFSSVECRALAYSMIPDARRESLHLKIGRKLWKSSSASLESMLSDIEASPFLYMGAQSFQLGMGLVTDTGELNLIANISIAAGKRAMLSSMFPLAAYYFELAISTLGDRLWQAESYDISLALYNGISEAYYCGADFDSVDRMLDVIFEKANTFEDKLQAYATLAYTNSARNRLADSLNVASFVLQAVGEQFPNNPSKYQVLMEYLRIRRLFHGKSDRYFLSLPVATNPSKVAAMRMLSFVSFTAYMVHPYLGFLTVFRLLRSALEYGITGPAVVAFASYSYILTIHMGRLDEGIRFGKLSLAFLDQGEGLPWLPRIHFNTHGYVFRTAFPYRDNLEPLRKANRLALKAGDMEGGMFISIALIPLLFHMGTPLRLVEDDLQSHIKLMGLLGQQQGLSCLVPMWQIISDLLGVPQCSLTLTGEIKDANSALSSAKEQNNTYSLEHYYAFKAIFSCLTGDFQSCLDLTRSSVTHTVSKDWTVFFEGLSSLALAQNSMGILRHRLMYRGQKCAKALAKLSRQCQDNFGSKEALIKAELAALKGRTQHSFALFDTAIELARKQGFLLEEGLAYERLGQFQSTLGSTEAAASCFECARSAYERWGAQTLATRMEKQLILRGRSVSQQVG